VKKIIATLKEKKGIIDVVKFLIIAFAIAVFACQPYFNNMMIYTHDFGYHLNRIIQINENLKNGIFPSFIHSGLLKNLGYANSIFYPEIFLYIPAILMLVFNYHVLNAYKIFLVLITFATFCTTYLSAKAIFKKKEVGYLTAILYTFSLYRLTDVFVRGALGEILSFIFLPLLLYGLYEVIFGDNKKWWIISIAFWGLANSHILTFVVVIPLVILICLLNIDIVIKDKRRLLNLVIAALIAVLLCVGFFGPMIEQKSNDTFKIDGESIEDPEVIKSRATSLSLMLGSNIKAGYAVDSLVRSDGMSEGIGAILLILAMLMFIRKGVTYKENRFEIQLFVIGGIVYFMTSHFFPWEKISFLSVLQFPFRLNFIPTLLYSFIGASCFYAVFEENNRRDFCVFFCIILLIIYGYVLSNVNIKFNPIYEKFEDLIEGIDHETGSAEYLPVNTDLDDLELYNINDKDKTYEFTQTGSEIIFEYDDEENDLEINMPLVYYKGYVADIELQDGSKEKLEVVKNNENGHVLVKSDEKLTGIITVKYKMTLIQGICYSVEIITFVGLIAFNIYKKRKDKE